LRYAVDPGWVGEIPMTIVLAPDGTIESLVGSLDLEQISALLHRYRAK
jgi:Mg-chelatase subunit ChlI